MTISTIRRVTDEDKAAVVRAAERFIARHGITLSYEGETAEEAIESEIERATEADGAPPASLACGGNVSAGRWAGPTTAD